MNPCERRLKIVDQAREQGSVSVSELSDHLGVTAETVRRDLAELDSQGLVNRTHGGALPMARPSYELGIRTRSDLWSDQKARIARRATEELGLADTIYIDEGSTAFAFAVVLDPRRALTVITPSIRVAQVLADHGRCSVLQLGGRMRPQSDAVGGQWALDMFAGFVVDVAFISANGLSREHGLTVADPAVAALKRVVLHQTRRTVLMTDASKIGKDAFATFGDLDDMETLITDTSAPRSFLSFVKTLGIRVIQC